MMEHLHITAARPAGKLDMPIKMRGEKVSVFYGAKQALYEVDLDVAERQVTALIGPSGCGKSTFLRTLNRMNDTIEGCRVEGRITLDGDEGNHADQQQRRRLAQRLGKADDGAGEDAGRGKRQDVLKHHLVA